LHAIAEALREFEILDGHDIDKILNGEKLERRAPNMKDKPREQPPPEAQEKITEAKQTGAPVDHAG